MGIQGNTMIASLQNPHVKDVVKLYKRKYRARLGRMIIEGYRAVLCAVENDYPLQALYVCPALFLGENEPSLIQRVAEAGAQVVEVAEEPFRRMAYRERPEGLLAVAPQVHRSLHDHPAVAEGCYLVAESIARPGNLGSILRSADGAGAAAVIVCNPWTDIFHPEVVRASVGTFFSVPILESTTEGALAWCRENGVRILAATPHADVLYTDADMRGPIAIVVGTEQYGLSASWLEQADLQVKLPMRGQADSLNVAAAATLLLYESVRQRLQQG